MQRQNPSILKETGFYVEQGPPLPALLWPNGARSLATDRRKDLLLVQVSYSYLSTIVKTLQMSDF